MDDKDSTRTQQVPPMSMIRTPTSDSPLATPAGVILETDLQSHIGRQLRAVYDEIVNEPVPDRFLKLLEELELQRTDNDE